MLPRGGPRSSPPRGCSGFWRLSPLPPEPLSRGLPPSPRLPADPVPRPGALVLLRPVAAAHPCLPPPAPAVVSSCADEGPFLPPYAVRPSVRRACPGAGRVPGRPLWPLRPRAASAGGWCGGSGSGPAPLASLPGGSAAPAVPGPGVAGRCPGPARAPSSGPPRCVGGVGAVPRLSAAPPPVRPRPRWRGPWPVSLARRCGRGRAVARWGASSRSPTLRAPALRGGGCCRCRRRRRRMCAPPCSARPAHRETLCRAPLLGGAGGLWLTALLPG